MALIKWGDEYLVGIDIIDAQHQKLVDTVNAFHDRRDDADQADVGDFIASLEKYAREHFATEEGYFAEWGYPAAAAHLDQHRMFIDHLASYRVRVDRGDLILPSELTNFMAAWLKEHVLSSDQRYGKFYRDRDCDCA